MSRPKHAAQPRIRLGRPRRNRALLPGLADAGLVELQTRNADFELMTYPGQRHGIRPPCRSICGRRPTTSSIGCWAWGRIKIAFFTPLREPIMNPLTVAVAAATLITGAAHGREPRAEEIIVTGFGEVALEPDRFAAVYEILGEADTRGEAVARSESVASAAREALAALEGLESLGLETLSAELVAVRDGDCLSQRRNDQHACPVTAWRFEQTIRIVGGPPQAAGAVVALGADLEVTEARLLGYELSDRQAGQRAADAAALADARVNAASLAEGMNLTLGPVTRIQSGDGFRSRSAFEGPSTVRFSASRRAPSVNLTLDPVPVRIRSQVIVAFEIQAD